MEHVFRISGENAGLHILLTSQKKVAEQDLIEAASEKGVKVYGLSDAMFGGTVEKYQNTIMLGYGALSMEEIHEGITLLKQAWIK